MEQTEGYVSGETPVVLVGGHTRTILNTRRKGFDYRPAGLTQSLAATYYDTMKNYFHYYLGNPVNFGDGDIQWQVAHMEEMYQMPLYPAPGSVRMMDGIMVVKLSQPTPED